MASHQTLRFDVIATSSCQLQKDQQYLKMAPQLVKRWELFQRRYERSFLQADRGTTVQPFERRTVRRTPRAAPA